MVLSERQYALAGREWVRHARKEQYPLGGAPANWLVIGGRGAGKTRLGAEWVHGFVHGLMPFTRRRHGLIALVGETLGDVREVMIEGPSGLFAISRGERPRLEVLRRRLLWDNGAVAQMFSSDAPEGLRGPQFDAAWCDELGKWRNADETFDMLQFGLRLGTRPSQIVTTTPRATPLMKRLVRDPAFTVSRMRTHDNAGNLAASFIAAVEKRYAATRLGRQELDGELIEDREGALWVREQLEMVVPVDGGSLRRIVVAVDPPATSGRNSNACGIVAAGLGVDERAYVLADATVQGAQPQEWARAAIALYHRLGADAIVAETNQGGDMVAAVLRTVDPRVPVKSVRATRGKWLRAEPVAALYMQGMVRHGAHFPKLCDEMCDFGPDGLSGTASPDRVDALVWAISELMLGPQSEPQIRHL
ncbi:DNA-packaging protein [Limoniibacter endophyticus]|uniref:DNA-packaging protein n=1 Tax=Limoniibacter endophyticus TaxID=1565040 RepID=UPI003612F5AD